MEDKSATDAIAVKWYIDNRGTYKKLTKKIESIISEILDLNNLSYHIITSRAKDIDSFKEKISNEKYDDPINQITDLAGIRIITYVEDEVESVSRIIEGTFDIDTARSLDKSKELGVDKVGYKSKHYIAKLRSDRLILPEYKTFEDIWFEIQIRTILQHAWAEIEHDRNYKFSGKLPDEISRRFKLLAGSLEISDREFNNIAREIDIISKKVEEGTKSGRLNFEINSTSLKQYLETKFEKLRLNGFQMMLSIDKRLLEELENYKVYSLKEFDEIVPDDFDEIILKDKSLDKKISAVGLVRAVLIINDSDKYFTNSWRNSWKYWSATKRFNDIFMHYKTDWVKIEKQYGIPFAGKSKDESEV